MSRNKNSNDFYLDKEAFEQIFPIVEAADFLPNIWMHSKTSDSIKQLSLQYGSETSALYAETMSLMPHSMGGGYHGGKCMARWILEHEDKVRGRSVLDIGSGSGLVAIVAAKAGASFVTALDSDTIAIEVIARNAQLNNVSIDVKTDLCDPSNLRRHMDHDIVISCDTFYSNGVEMEATLIEFARAGKTIYAASYGNDLSLIGPVSESLQMPKPCEKWLKGRWHPLADFICLDGTSFEQRIKLAEKFPFPSATAARTYLRQELLDGGFSNTDPITYN